MWKKVLLVFVALIAILVVIIALQPAQFAVARSVTIAAPPERVFAQVNDFRAWNAWSPWAKIDPNCAFTYSDPSAGAGATYSWVGNSDVGEGKMAITESKPAEHVGLRLEFIKPFAATNQVLFVLKPEAAGTHVTWTMSGEKNFLMKAMCLFVSMDKMVGGDFEKGLASMKAVAERLPLLRRAPSAAVVEGNKHLGWSDRLAMPLGVLELTILVIYLIPQTAVLGAILLTGYLGGAVASHVRVGDPFFIPVVLGVVFWLGLYLRDPRLRQLIPLRRV